MAVVLDLTQSGSGSTKIAAQPGDTVSFQIANTLINDEAALATAMTALGALTAVTGVTFTFSLAGGAS